jgi:hypothetical protein
VARWNIYKPKIPLEGLGMEIVGIFLAILEYFVTIWYF